jgi:hypothetical protein
MAEKNIGESVDNTQEKQDGRSKIIIIIYFYYLIIFKNGNPSTHVGICFSKGAFYTPIYTLIYYLTKKNYTKSTIRNYTKATKAMKLKIKIKRKL